ncbi:hypothetical protein HPP92_005867 [Vanilla planifolia]|uniref:1-phosphatidylinositol-3-phosphate 5-kinase n=2 Tax=Vanilla planifolia TaxID=51239 RepID=A0A835RJB4_VANPL|nr:hypothetical protein HPP92_005867 [Vanilla planifolia]
MFSELLELVKSWFPRRSEPAYMTRDFWMPDNSCRVCYECDTPFTIFVRKHHCRVCGRVFCWKCTANSMPLPSADPKDGKSQGDRVRVCNYCFDKWKQEVVDAADENVTTNCSSSTASLASSRSSETLKSSTMTAGSMSYPNGTYQRVHYGSVPSPIITESGVDKQSMLMLGRSADSVEDTEETCNTHFNYYMNRNDDDGYSLRHFDSEVQNFQNSDDYYDTVEFEEIDQDYDINNVHLAEEDITSLEGFSPVLGCTNLQGSAFSDKFVDTVAVVEHSDECGASSSIYGLEVDDESEDFENNGLLWLPPEPEDEEDEREAILVDQNDDVAARELLYLRSSKNFGTSESRNRDRSSDEHRKAMNNVVGGHFRALIAQLLQVENLPIGEENDKESWLEIITSLSWEAATLLKPDMSKGGGMDPGGYVKVKCVACGHNSQSMVVRGVVCKKNVVHRRMMSKIEKPRLLILGGALEYHRVMNSLSSFDTLLQQEMDHLKMAVARIGSHDPHVLLVEKSVSRFAQDYLLARNISLVLNVKRSFLERLSRCSGAAIIPSIDDLSSPKLGHCDLFHVENFFEEHGTSRPRGKKNPKTLMFFEGCPKPLGCTIILKGAHGDELKKVKHVVQYGVFAAYHLALETSFLVDEGASLPELPLKSPITVALPDKPHGTNRSISTIPGFANSASHTTLPDSIVDVQSSQDASSKQLRLNNQNCNYRHFILVVLVLNRWTSSLVLLLNQLLRKKDIECLSEPCVAATFRHDVQKHVNINPIVSEDGLNFSQKSCKSSYNSTDGESQVGSSEDVLNLISDNSQLQEVTLLKDEFSASSPDHQSILVSLSSRCVWKGTVCERSHLFRIKYYGSFDKPLGRYLRDHLFDQSYCCPSCDMPSEAHVHCYNHQQGSLTISVRKLPEFCLPGERDGKIWMWHRCLRCPRVRGFPPATRRIMMSDAAWGLSFGKFLELSFSNHAAASRVASCGHSLHRDCLRFYGYGKMVACFRYASINVHSVYLPPHMLEFNHEPQEWIRKEANQVKERKDQLFSEVSNSLRSIADKHTFYEFIDCKKKVPELERNVHELEEMLRNEKEEFEESLNMMLRKVMKKGEPAVDILEINKLRRQLVFQSYLWDQRLICAAGAEYRPHEFLREFLICDEKFVAAEMPADSNVASKMSRVSSTSTINTDSRQDEAISSSNSVVSDVEEPRNQRNFSNTYQQMMDAGVENFEGKEDEASLFTSASVGAQLDPLASELIGHRTFSDGQYPMLANLSDTFDAKWTGENGSVLANLSITDSSVPVNTATALLALEDKEEKAVVNVTESMTTVLHSNLDSAEEFSSWIGLPFLNLYCSFNRSLGNVSRLELLNEYNPVYISLFGELESQNWASFLLPLGEIGIVIPVYEDEPTSVISYVLASNDYNIQTSNDPERTRDVDSSSQSALGDPVNLQLASTDELSSETYKSFGSAEESILSLPACRNSFDPLSYTKTLHARVSFEDDGPSGKVKYTVTCYYAKCFNALRRTCCPSELDYIRYLSRCKKWGAQGGKSNVFFAKSLDERFIIKQVTKTEIESFMKFAPEYFKYLSESIATRSPTCLAKILGIYQVASKHLKGGKEMKMDVLVMENLLFGQDIKRLYDLKGSSRSRYNPDCTGNNKVLLDQNLIEAMPTSPIFVGNKAKRLLERAVWNDTSFLASIDVMDYSLLVGVDEKKHELVIGIIDFMRQYTWDKHLETWVKASGILGGPKNASPTVVSPKQYKKRFRKAMSAYFLVVPDQWFPSAVEPTKFMPDLQDCYNKTATSHIIS